MNVLIQAGSGASRSLSEHRNAGLEIVYIEKGRLHWQVEGRREWIGPGSIFFTLPWQRHGSVREFEPGHKWHFVVIRLCEVSARRRTFRFPATLGLGKTETAGLVKLFTHAPRHALNAGPQMAARVCELAASSGQTLWIEKRRAALAALLILDLGELLTVREAHTSHNIDAVRMNRVADAIRKDFARSWTLGELAAKARLAKSRFCELFRRETGDSLFQFINRIRVEEARRLLRETDHSVTAIAHHCGFSSSQYFANVFRNFTGHGAREYRALQIAEAPHPPRQIY